jgi:hypothetical protein
MTEEDTLLRVVDLGDCKNLVSAAWMAMHGLPLEAANPLGTLLDLVEHRLDELVDRLNAIREMPDAAELEAQAQAQADRRWLERYRQGAKVPPTPGRL